MVINILRSGECPQNQIFKYFIDGFEQKHDFGTNSKLEMQEDKIYSGG